MAAGDHIFVKRAWYKHHGVEVYEGAVIHFSGAPGGKSDATIRSASIDEFAGGAPVKVRQYAARFDVDESVRRAESKLGQSGYSLFANNCEHFACWCVTGKHSSPQVNGAAATGGVVTVSSAAAAGGIGIVAAVGEVGGLSGAGIMSGLATAGGVAGGGAVGGLATLGAGPGLLSVAVMNVALRDDKALPGEERSARRVGRRASVAGMAAGGAAGVGAVGALGTVSGLSAAGITSGLAAVGGSVGGGMAAGSAVVMAGPAVAAAAAGYGAYRAVRWWRNRSSSASSAIVATD